MVNGLKIRSERKEDYKIVEEMTRKAFYNLYVPGCVEHYLVHIMRSHEDFIHDLDFVAEMGGKVTGNIMYTKAMLVDEKGNEKQILTFGPMTVDVDHQRKGIGKKLMAHSFHKAAELGYDTIVIFGKPANYVTSGFKSCKKYNVCLGDGSYPSAMLVKELNPNALDGRKWFYSQSPVFDIDENDAQEYDDSLERMEKKYQPSQEEFYIHSHSTLV